MRKVFLVLFVLIFSSITFAQMSIIGSLGMGGGVIFGSLNPNLKELNLEFQKVGLKEFEGGMFGFGGGGGLTLGNIRLGGYGIGGSKEVRTSITGGEMITKLDYGYGLFVAGYEVAKFGDLRFAIDIGIGGGSVDLDLINKSQSSIPWNTVFLPSSNSAKNLSMSFFYYQPSIVIEYIYGGFTKFFIAGDYSGIINGKWRQDGEFDLTNVPDMKFNGFALRAGVYLGIFL
ncbi:MAG: hypothetical protein FJ213_10795 [Ignavibacteria bacterium]|nr:hypothetical protein [Ignavibacteria bacterium]